LVFFLVSAVTSATAADMASEELDTACADDAGGSGGFVFGTAFVSLSRAPWVLVPTSEAAWENPVMAPLATAPSMSTTPRFSFSGEGSEEAAGSKGDEDEDEDEDVDERGVGKGGFFGGVTRAGVGLGGSPTFSVVCEGVPGVTGAIGALGALGVLGVMGIPGVRRLEIGFPGLWMISRSS